MSGIMYGYARVSSKEQNEARQVIALTEFGVQRRNIIIEKKSGKDFNRDQYKKLCKKMKPGDILVIKSIDRIGRNYDEIQKQWAILTKKQHIDIVVLDMPLLDTRQDHDLTGRLIADIVLQLLSYVAQTEREYIHERQAEGIAAAKARGVRFGRRPYEIPEEFGELYEVWKNGLLSAREGAKHLGVCHKTFLKWCNEKQLNQAGKAGQ